MLAIPAVVAAAFWLRGPDADELTRQAAQHLQAADFDAALRGAAEVLERDPRAKDALRIAVEASGRLDRQAECDAYLEQLGDLSLSPAESFQVADLCLQIGRVAAAEHYLRKVVAAEPSRAAAHEQLLMLLRVEGRYWDLRAAVRSALLAGFAFQEALIPVGCPSRIWIDERDREFVERCRRLHPGDPLPEMGTALRSQVTLNDTAPALAVLREIVRSHPQISDAQAELGLLLLWESDAAFLEWERSLPSNAEEHPRVWLARGLWLKAHGRREAAVRCYAECVRIDSENRAGWFELGQSLAAGEIDDALRQECQIRARELADLEREIEFGDGQGGLPGPALMRRISDRMAELGRNWEACGWAALALQQQPNLNWAADRVRVLQSRLRADTPWCETLPQFSQTVEPGRFPLPEFDGIVPDGSGGTLPEHRIAFVARAADIELDFRFQNGAVPDSGRALVFEFSGGGVATMDYDRDLWPDLYFTQGTSWPPGTASSDPSDSLFRNLRGIAVRDVTSAARLTERDYGQGASVGDFDNDGWPDLYIANIGGNKLWHNLGDGTFADVTEQAGMAGSVWTVSCVVADLSGDGLPDCYDANYLSGPDVFTRTCTDGRSPTQCAPTMFPAEPDRLHLNLGDGTFRDATQDAGMTESEGKGMGLIVADFRGDGQLGLFVANDTTPNFLFLPRRDRPGFVSFADDAAVLGVDLGEAGAVQSCMGVAAGDADNDGRVDLFVTNFVAEANNLFLQREDGTFEDSIRPANLFQAGYSMMGWGTQFLDADLDGDDDLFVANGHLMVYPSADVQSLMPMHCFVNDGHGRFALATPDIAGSYFSERHLGRAVARLDWNRDGCGDLAVTHVDAPAVLLENVSAAPRDCVRIHLRGVSRDRDAIGAAIRFPDAPAPHWTQLVAGDGFQASNERILTIVLTESGRPRELEVRWPGGLSERWHLDWPLAGDYALVEGRGLLTLPDGR